MLVTAMETLSIILDGGPDTEGDELAGLTKQLRRCLLELDVEAVDLIRTDEIPVGAKPVEAFTLGALAVTSAAGTVRAVIDLVGVWLKARPVRGAKITLRGNSLELTASSSADQQRLIQAFIDEHTQPPPGHANRR